MPRFQDIPQFTRSGSYEINVHLSRLPKILGEYETDYDLQRNPDFQRGHVWTTEQQTHYVEFLLRGGQSSRIIYFNHPGWHRTSIEGPFVLVDGLQRITACERFFRNEIAVFGYYYSQYGDKTGLVSLRFNVNDLPTRKDVLQWYLDLNSGGVVHTTDEIDRVKRLLADELLKLAF